MVESGVVRIRDGIHVDVPADEARKLGIHGGSS